MWTAYLFQCTTGQIGPQIQLKSASWSISLNDTESCKVEFVKSELPLVNLDYWLAPWWGGVLLMWNEVPVFAGPIISHPTETFTTFSVDCQGFRALLARRRLIHELADWTTISKDVVAYNGLSLGTIAQRIIWQVQQKPGGTLPVAFPIPEETTVDDADHQRTYRGFNIANINVDDILTKLSNVINGPDIMFRPRLVSDSKLVWDFLHGTEHNPRIAQRMVPIWDSTPDTGGVVDLQITMTGAYQAHRVYSVGAGQDEGTLIRMAQDLTPTAVGYPLLESYVKIGDSEDPNVVYNWGAGYLDSNKRPLREITMTVRADGLYRFGQYWSGDLVQFIVKDWWSLKDGTHNARLLNMSGDLTDNIRLQMQTEE